MSTSDQTSQETTIKTENCETLEKANETQTDGGPQQCQVFRSHSKESENFETREVTDGKINGDDEKASQPQMSKRALKRQKRQEQWEQRKKEKRAKEREKRKKRHIDDPAFVPRSKIRKQLKNSKMANSNCHVSIVVDLSLDDYMDEKSLAKCIKQVCRCYGINRRATNPVQYHITSNTGRSLTEIAKNIGYENWDVHLHDQHFMDVFDKTKVIYLTSESDNILEKIEDDKVYIIGGLVDHNKHKGLCHKLAVEKGIAHGRLPIGEHIDMKTRKVLTIDHVFNILVNVANGQAWKETFLSVIPERKGAKAKEDSDADDDDERNDEDDEETKETKDAML